MIRQTGYNTDMKLNELQSIIFDILSEMDNIAKEEEIDLYLFGGTEIGAVREKDIIAWDDDADTQMFYRDFLRYKEALKKKLPPYLRLSEPYDTEPYFFDFVARVEDTRYLLRKETEEDAAYGNHQNHPAVDIFLIMNGPESKLQQHILYYRSLFLYAMALGHRYDREIKAPFVVKLGLKCIGFLGRLTTVSRLYDHFLKMCSAYEGKKTGTAAMMNDILTELGASGRVTDWSTAFIPKKWFEKPAAEGTLRGRTFSIPSGYHEQLTMMYGDYMKPPEDIDAFNRHLPEEEE